MFAAAALMGIFAVATIGPLTAQEVVGPDAVWNGDAFECSDGGDTALWMACMERLGAPTASLRFAKMLSENPSVRITGVLQEFYETGVVDIGRVILPGMANSNEQFFLLNSEEDSVLSLFRFLQRDAPTDPGSRAFIATFPTVSPVGMIGIVAVREMSGGIQRFVLQNLLADCRACQPVGISTTHVDFRDGALVRVAAAGFEPFDPGNTPNRVTAMLVSGDERTLQSRLSRLGYEPGGVDGSAGPNTIAALNALQNDLCLPRSNRLSAEVIATLSADLTLEVFRPVVNCKLQSPSGPLPLLDGTYAFGAANCEAGPDATYVTINGENAAFNSATCQIASVEREGDFAFSTLLCPLNGSQSQEPWNLRIVSETSFTLLNEHSSDEIQADLCAASRLEPPVQETTTSVVADTNLRSLPFPDGQYTWWDIGCEGGAIIPMPGIDASPMILQGSEVQFGNARCEVTEVDEVFETLDVDLNCDMSGAALEWNWRINPLSDATFEGRLNEGQINTYAFCAPSDFEGADASLPMPSDEALQMRATLVEEILTAYENDRERISLIAQYADHAVLAWAAYEDPDALAQAARLGWTAMQTIVGDAAFGDGIVDSVQTAFTGTAVATLFVSDDGETVLSFRGTATGKDWLTNTFGSLSPLTVTQVSDAVRIAEEIAKRYPDVTFVGHSLGGRLAQAARLATGSRAVVFNSAPLGIAEDTDRIVQAIVDGLAGSVSGAKQLVRFRGPEDALTRTFSPDDIIVSNVINAEAVKSLPNGTGLAVVLGYAIADQIDVAHNIGLLYGAMENVRGIWREGWVQGPFPAGLYATESRFCEMTSDELNQLGDAAGQVIRTIQSDGTWVYYESSCQPNGYSEVNGIVTLQTLCSGEGATWPGTTVVRRLGAARFEQNGNNYSLCKLPDNQSDIASATERSDVVSPPRAIIDLQIPPMQRGATESLRVVTNWPNETPSLMILSTNGWISPDSVSPARGLPDLDPAALTRSLQELDRSSALALLRDQVVGGLFISNPRHQTIRIPPDRLGLVQEALTTVILSPDLDVRRAQMQVFTELPDFVRMDLDMSLLEVLHFASKIGLDFIGTWQVGEVGSSQETWQIIAVGVPVSRQDPTPQLNRQGTLLGLIEVDEVTGIFATEASAEVEFTIRPDGDISALIDEAESYGLRNSIILRLPQRGEYRDISVEPGRLNGVWTATFRRYDDGWRVSDVR
jgi:hypothetical protein